MNATSIPHEPLIPCDFSELQNVPPFPYTTLITLKGKSAAQVSYAATVRVDKLAEWRPDLPENVMKALYGVADATWWLSNKDNDISTIRWPKSWVKPLERNPGPPETDGQLPFESNRNQVLTQAPVRNGHLTESDAPTPDASQFEAFARKAAQSPELAYLTIMALFYRSTKNKQALQKFRESRDRVESHLEAIDTIIGES